MRFRWSQAYCERADESRVLVGFYSGRERVRRDWLGNEEASTTQTPHLPDLVVSDGELEQEMLPADSGGLALLVVLRTDFGGSWPPSVVCGAPAVAEQARVPWGGRPRPILVNGTIGALVTRDTDRNRGVADNVLVACRR